MAERPPFENPQSREQALRRIIEGLFEIAAPGAVKNALWTRYQSLTSANKQQSEHDLREAFTLLPQQIRSHNDYRAWLSWVERADDDQLLAALHTCESWQEASAGLLRDELQQRGYILVGKEPRDITLEKAEG